MLWKIPDWKSNLNSKTFSKKDTKDQTSHRHHFITVMSLSGAVYRNEIIISFNFFHPAGDVNKQKYFHIWKSHFPRSKQKVKYLFHRYYISLRGSSQIQSGNLSFSKETEPNHWLRWRWWRTRRTKINSSPISQRKSCWDLRSSNVARTLFPTADLSQSVRTKVTGSVPTHVRRRAKMCPPRRRFSLRQLFPRN